jgi:hypothetical protein
VRVAASFFRTNGALAGLLMIAEVVESQRRLGADWVSTQNALEKAFVYVHATQPAHNVLYRSHRYNFSPYKEVSVSGVGGKPKVEYLLQSPLNRFLQTFQAYSVFEKLTGIGRRLQVSPEKAFEIYLNVKAHTAPEYLDYHPAGVAVRKEKVPHYYPKLVKMSPRTKTWREHLDKIAKENTSKSFEELKQVFDFSSELENEVLALFKGRVTYEEIFGSSDVLFVDGIDANTIDAEDIPVFLASVHKAQKKWNAKQVVFRFSSENPMLRYLYNLGAAPVKNPLSIRDQVMAWTDLRRPRWQSHSEEHRQQIAPMFLETAKMLGLNPYYFYKTSYDWPAMPDQLMALSVETLADISKSVSQTVDVLFDGEQSQQLRASTLGGL